ncbi:tape measure protein [Pseudoalteromonas sp. S16_S37]|uniref:tape measure protein n=1 Tax=Pseudoalteromonas sp. S16_S37 TaxID=2720228 RepID=UPI00168059E2|nr:tape measure protein [Pseudoalteromonas sp. S16_S37]MBD1584762.1 tape measure protein [Pseudoalteromonas sp. S16_S37]
MANKTLELALRVVAEATGKQNIEQLVAELRNIEQSAERANPATEKLSEQIDGVATSANNAEPKTDQLNKALNDTTQTANTTAITAGRLANELDDLGDLQQLIRAFEQSKQKLEQQEIATASATQALDELQRQAQDSNQQLSALAQGTERAERDLKQLRDELTQNTGKHAALQAQLKRSGVDTNDLRVAKRNLGAQFDKAGKSVDKFTNDLKQGNAAQQAHAASLSKVAGQVAALAAAYFGLDRVASAVNSVFETGDKFEKLGIQMQALMGGIAGGAKATEWVTQFTKNTPLQLGEVSQAFVKLKAFGLDPMDGTLQSITDQALKLGGGFEEVQGISLALGQAWAKQKLQGEEILQLVERGIPVWELLEKVTGKNVQELQKLSSAGKLGRDVIKQLIDEMGRTSAGSAAAQMALFSGQVSNAKDNLEQFYNLIAQSGAMDWLKNQLTTLNTEFAAMAADGRLQEWAQSISDTIVNTGTVIKDAVSTLYDYREEIGFVAKAWLALKIGGYFSSVVSGAVAATRAFTTYKTAITSATVATNAATVATNKWKSAIGFIARGGLYTVLINEVFNVGVEYNKLITLEQKLAKSQRDAKVSSAKLAEELRIVSENTGVLITSTDELDAAVAKGTIVWNERAYAFEGVAKKQQELAEAAKRAEQAERERQAFLTLTLTEALKVTESLEQQAQNLNGVRDGVDGFIQSVNSARTALVNSGTEYSQQVVLLDYLKAKFEAHNESLARQAYLADDVSKAYKELGLTSSTALEQTATKLQGAFELIQQQNEPIAMQQQAFLKWAEAAIKAADATDQTVPASVQAAAAALGLTKELDKLVEKANALKPVTDTNSEAVKRFTVALDATNAAIKQNQQVLASSTATAEQKAQAQAALTKQQARLTQQTEDLNKVQQYELATLSQLKAEQSELINQVANLDNRYRAGTLSGREYNEQKARLESLLRVVNGLLGDFKTAQDDATAATKRGTQATKEATQAAESSFKSLRKQKEELEKVSQSAARASTNINNYTQSSRPTVSDIVDYQEKYETDGAYSFESAEVQAEKQKRARAKLAETQYNRFERDIKGATTTNALNDLYVKAIKQLSYLDQEQKQRLADAIAEQKKALKAKSNQTPISVSQALSGLPNISTASNQATVSRSDSALTEAINKLTDVLTRQHSGKTVVLQLSLPNGQTAEMYAHVRDELLNELEQLSNAQ